jgi:hypothetical protein
MTDCSLRTMFGDPEKFMRLQKSFVKQFEPLVRLYLENHEAMSKELEPLIRYIRSEEYQAHLRAMAIGLQSVLHLKKIYSASDWIKDCRLGTHGRNSERLPKPKPILGFLGGVPHD